MNNSAIHQIKTTRGTFTVREFCPKDQDQVLSSWEKAFNKKVNPDYWHWKYNKNPGGFRTIVCLDENGTVAVHYAGLGTRTWFHDQKIIGLQFVDIYSHPKYRWAIGGKTGLFVKTARIFWQTFVKNAPFDESLSLNTEKEKVSFVWGLPGKRHARLGQMVIKYGTLPKAIFLESSSNSSKIKSLFFTLQKVSPQKDDIPQGVDSLWEKVKKNFSPFCIIKDKKYIFWRYWVHPIFSRDYIFYTLKRPWSSKIYAWAVLKKTQEQDIVMDFLAESKRALEMLLKLILLETRQKIVTWLSEDSFWKDPFFKNGFIQKKEPLGIVPSIQSFSNGIMDKKNEFHWTIGDADLY